MTSTTLDAAGFVSMNSSERFRPLVANVTVHRAAANDVDFRTRAARGSVWNGLQCHGLFFSWGKH